MNGTDLEKEFAGLFGKSSSGLGEEELLRVASNYAMQLSTKQMKALLYLGWVTEFIIKKPEEKAAVQRFIENWLSWKQYNNSDIFVMKALENISLRKFFGENSMKVNIEK